MYNKTELTDVNEDCLFLICKNLNLDELLSLAEANEKFVPIAVDIYRRNYALMHVRIITPFSTSPIDKYHIEVSYIGISIRHFEAASRFLKYFGYLIPSLELIYNLDEAIGSEKIDKLISLHCSETLKSFTVFVDKKGFFDDFIRPFRKVEYIQLVGEFTSLDSLNLTFDELFPVVQTLYLGEVRLLDRNGIDRKFPNLDNVSVYLARPGGKSLNEADIERLIKKNSQIKRLNLMNASRKSLEVAAKILLKLENLRLLWYAEQSDNGEKIHFENLRSFAMIDGSHSMPSHVTFGELEEFETKALPAHCTRWLDFVVNDARLKKLLITGKVNDTIISYLATAHLTLHELSIKCEIKVKDETIIQLIENTVSLKKLKLVRSTYKDGTPKSKSLKNTGKVLQKIYSEHWNITDGWFEIDLKRKN